MSEARGDEPFAVGVTCFRGLADVLAAEIAEAGVEGARVVDDELVILPAATATAPLAGVLRTARRILRVLAWGAVTDVASVEALGEGLRYEGVLRSEASFGVLCERLGHHAFTSEDVGRVLGSCIRRRFRAEFGEVPAVALRAPEQQVLAYVRDGVGFFGLDLHGALDERREGDVGHHAPLNPALAAALLRASSCRRYGAVLDPMAGSGTIAVEAARLGIGRIVAGEKYRGAFGGLVTRLRAGGLEGRVRAVRGDAATLDYVEPGSCPVVVTNPPYGIRIGTPEQVEALYRDFALAAAAKGVEETVAITTRKRVWLEAHAAAGYELALLRPVLYERLTVWLAIHRRAPDRGALTPGSSPASSP